MNMTKLNNKKLTNQVTVPQNRGEADVMIKELGDTNRKIERVKSQMNDELAEVKKKFEAKAQPLQQAADDMVDGLEKYCSANREHLTKGGKTKTIPFGNGDCKWRHRPPKVTIRGMEAVLKTLKSKGLDALVRVKEEINKDAILDDPASVAGIKGISVGSAGEDFIVEPFEEELAGAKS